MRVRNSFEWSADVFGIAKVTAKSQTTIPQDVRNALQVSPGDLAQMRGSLRQLLGE